MINIRTTKITFNPLPNNKVFRLAIFGRVENIVGEGENAFHQHFQLFPLCFKKALPNGL